MWKIWLTIPGIAQRQIATSGHSGLFSNKPGHSGLIYSSKLDNPTRDRPWVHQKSRPWIENLKSVYPDGKATWGFYSYSNSTGKSELVQDWFHFGHGYWFTVGAFEIVSQKTKIPSLCPVGEQWYKKCTCHDRQSGLNRWSSRHKSNTCFCGDQEWHKSNPIREDVPKFDCCQEGFQNRWLWLANRLANQNPWRVFIDLKTVKRK